MIDGTPGSPGPAASEGAPGADGQFVDVGTLRRLRWGIVVGLGSIVVLSVALALSLPRALTYPRVLDENLKLKEQLGDLDRRMSEIDRILLRLRLYDAQLESLAGPKGESGPLPALANGRMAEALGMPDQSEDEVAEGLLDLEHVDATDRALSVRQRADDFLARIQAAEPNLSQLVVELEDLRALREALPRVWPARGHMTSGFGWRRNPALGQRWKFHSGLDIEGKRGQPIFAAAAGEVIRAHYNMGYGRMVEIDHDFGITTLYAHCTRLEVRKGQRVEAGQRLGTIGSTGRSTGPHLHFEVRIDDHAVDPLDYISPR